MNKNVVITITGPTCSGKSTFEAEMCKNDMFYKIRSTTTRTPRKGERDGVDYFFVDHDKFNTIEMMETVKLGVNYYGASVAEFQNAFDQEKIPVVVVEPNGMCQINEKCLAIGWSPINIYMDVTNRVKYTRLLKRFFLDARDAIIAMSTDEFHQLVVKYADRLTMMSEEESQWTNIFLRESVNPLMFEVNRDEFSLSNAIKKVERHLKYIS